MKWNKIDQKEPNDSQFPHNYCLVAVMEYVAMQTHIATYYRMYEEESSGDFDEDYQDYNEEEDQYYIKAGWYQECPEVSEYSSMAIFEPVVAWAELPKFKET